MLAELFNLGGVVSVTVLSVNYWSVATGWLRQWVSLPAHMLAVLVFWGLFVSLIFGMHLVLRRITDVIKWERFHWMLQGMGVFLGGLRGLWWSGFLLVIFTSSGFIYLRDSVEQRSVLGPRLLSISRANLERIADKFPGAQYRDNTLVPPVRYASP